MPSRCLALIGSGLRIFRAFPSFGPKLPQNDLLDVPKVVHHRRMAGRRLAVALHLHVDLSSAPACCTWRYQFATGHFRQVLFMPRDVKGVWPMARHYFLFGPKPPLTAAYNPLQKLAYTSAVIFGVLSTLTGLVLYKPVQFSWLAWMMGGFHLTRVWHFLAMCGFFSFIPGHLIMVLLHGWNNFYSMLTGWKRDPEYLS